jgi:carbamoyltransferase
MPYSPVVLGVNCSFRHDSAAAVIAGDSLRAACEEERFSGIKHDATLPWEAINASIRIAGADDRDVTHIALGWHPYADFLRRVRFVMRSAQFPEIGRRARFLARLVRDPMTVASELKRRFRNARVEFVPHHFAHAASAFYVSPFERASVLTIDGRGEWATGLAGTADTTGIHPRVRSFWPNSIGLAYEAFTHYLGFDSHDEFKVMGLSSYGDDRYIREVRRTFSFHPTNLFRVNLRYFRHPSFSDTEWSKIYYSDDLCRLLGPPRQRHDDIDRRHENIAKSLQTHLEDVGVAAATWLRSTAGIDDLVMAGGVALNGLMNNAIRTRAGFSRVFIQPASNDAGIAIGSALYVNHQILKRPRRFQMRHAYWGPQYSPEEILTVLRDAGLPFYACIDPPRTAARLIAENAVIGWFQGRMEFGPRALGNRSILADPRDPTNKDRVNSKVKFREEFRPFAPSIMAEHVYEYFGDLGDSPYMLNICDVRPEVRDRIPAVVHVDSTARPQTVRATENPRFHALLSHFHRVTGIPLILNTSFNVKNMPIVNSPADAINCFLRTELDYVIIGDYLIARAPLTQEDCASLDLRQ